MKKSIKLWAAAAAAAAVFGWYFSPGMLRLRAMPQIVEEPDSQGALLCSIKQNGGAAYVRKSKDASLGTQYTVSLFGIIPLRTIEQATAGTLVTLGGEALGIVLHTKGVQVVGFAGVETKDGRLAPRPFRYRCSRRWSKIPVVGGWVRMYGIPPPGSGRCRL